ncbi:MAG: type I polyketide synthase [Beijerinckiaceae bacterium]|nr:type I polyketide synthase [Beijerinckiaceae bacterium]
MTAQRKSSHSAIIGAACRLPGASSVAEFWSLLVEGRNSVRRQPDHRWSVERFLRPGNPEPGFAYTFAGGYLDDPLGFDPAPFGVSPREAQQMDPQQRLLLEVVWEALEDAGIPASSVAGTQVGVYVGASMVDYQGTASLDPAVMESHFMTGNSLAVLSNRISYIYDFKGPSFTLDSACSSSFVALKQATDALEEGKIDLAVVAGVNMLLSPVPFIGFSQARMLSPTGLSRPFSAKADGYVRSEGAVVLVLRRERDALDKGERIRGFVVGASVNSDGRTTGISLPSIEGQRDLIDRFYADIGVAPDALAFVEAHGTGTKVGDPIEANAIGQSLGQKRKAPLPIGSVKSNIGHLEAASGLAGLLKSILALEHRLLPPSLFLDQTNEMIDFEALNLVPNAAARPLALENGAEYAAICNYGFGGTNAHVLVKAAPPAVAAAEAGRATHLMLTAADRESLARQAERVADALDAGLDAGLAAATLAHGRDALKTRLVVPLVEGQDAAAALRLFADGQADSAGHASGQAASADAPVVFVFSGNGSQYAEMGHAAYAGNARFRAEVAEIDALFRPLSGWSLTDKLTAPVPSAELEQTSIAQPLIYAIQSALAGCLAEAGIRPSAVLGHSVGEVAAAEASGALSRAEAVRLIYLRSKHQEKVRGLGRMMVVAAESAQVERLLQAFGAEAIEIAAYNSGTSTTVSGPADLLKSFAKHCRAARVATVALDIDYPFHSSVLDAIGPAMVADLAGLAPRATEIPFCSTVTGEVKAGETLDAEYWWQNIRRPVRFMQALLAAAPQDGRIYLEVGPRAILTGPIAETLRDAGRSGETLASLSQKDKLDPVALVVARLIAHGASVDRERVFGPRPARMAELPGYAFQRQSYQLPGTSEHFNAFGKLSHSDARHPLLGARMADGSPEWRALLDPAIVPYLDDHRVDGGVIVPAAGLIEMALAAGRDLFGERPLQIAEFDVLRALAIAQDETREISTRYAEAANTIEVWSRKRFSAQEWVLHARGRIEPLSTPVVPPLPGPDHGEGYFRDTPAEVYAEATLAGLDYGPMFQLVTASERDDITTHARLRLPDEAGLGAFMDRHVLSPVSLDASFHGLFIARPQKEGEKKAHLPVRFRGIKVWRHGVPIRQSITRLTNETDRFKTVAITLMDEAGEVVAFVEAAVLRALYLGQATTADRTFRIEALPITLPAGALARLAKAEMASNDNTDDREVPPAWLIARAFAVSLAHRIAIGLAPDGKLDPAGLVAGGQVAEDAQPLLEAARVILEGFGLVQGGVLVAENPLPPAEEVLTTLVTNFADANLEIRLAAQALAHAERLIRQGGRLAVPPSARDQIETSGLLVQPALVALREALAAMAGQAGRKLRVLAMEPWSAGLLMAVTPLVRAGVIEVTLVAPNRKAIDNARLMGKVDPEIEFLNLEDDQHLASPVGFDVLAGVASAPLGGEDGIPASLRGVLRPDATVLVAQPGADATLDFLLGLWAGWFAPAGRGEAGLPRTPSPERTRESLERFGAVTLATRPTSDGLGGLITGQVPALARDAADTAYAVVVAGLTAFDKALARGADLMLAADATLGDRLVQLAQEKRLPPHLVYPVSLDGADAVERVATHIEAIKRIAEALEPLDSGIRVTICTQGAHDDDAEPAATASSLWGFLRVAINEFPTVDLRLADFDPALPDAAAPMEGLLGLSGGELEVLVRADGLKALRMRRNLFPPARLGEDERSVLKFEQAGRLDSFTWLREKRQMPGAGEIEIEVAAVGLNFRDILVGLGILDDDLLGAGLTAAALGFECSGIVTRTGAGVTDLRVGDAVMGFAANTFASHLVSPAWHFFKVPEGVSLDAAATIPVAFATAWFALVKRAQIAAGDDVLIHGGAGGVGLAAIQFAKQAGSRVLATASSEERRAIARAMGADLTFDSRQERFAEAIRSQLGGVDVVLNSLAGPAMVASFRLVKPFGRFVELGKRDYLDNTQLGLRPFVRNIAYYGVDLDELLAHDRPLVEAMMKTISAQFASGTLKPLPYRVFEGEDVGTAFRLMQASEHVGKIVVRPSKLASRSITGLQFRAKPGAYLVVGGTSGLGFATARWLAGKGAGTLVLASRRGRVEEGLEGEVDALRARGVTVEIVALDVSDREAVDALVRDIAERHGPLRGVIHAAVLLDDGMISGLTPDRLRAVLQVKIDGARHLDAATAGQPLDFFVVYSSATTVIGSPGQGAYVAANAWLEGFARERRKQGKPALAIGWGAISDVGIIARDKQLGRRLRRTTGVVGISSSESLAHLGRLLVLGNEVGPMQFYTNISPGAAAEKLRLINSPAFAGLGLARREEDGEQEGDLVTAIEGKSRSEAITIIVGALKREISHILRMPEEQIDVSRPLGELGLDSLMALELQLSIERLCGTDVPLVGAGDRRLGDIAAMIHTSLGGGGGDEDAADPGANIALAMSGLHGGNITSEEAEALSQKLKMAGGRRGP